MVAALYNEPAITFRPNRRSSPDRSVSPVFAGPYADTLGKCMVSATTGPERATLVRWIVVMMGLHPALEGTGVTPEQRTAEIDAVYIGFAVRADSPIMTGRDLIERLKKDASSLTAGVTAIGGNNHIAYVMAARGGR